MDRTLVVPIAAIAAALLSIAAPSARGQTGSLAATLHAAGLYLTQFAHDVSGVVMAEDYLQQAQAQVLMARRLGSDVAVFTDNASGWVEFRDVATVDGKPVSDRQTRAVDLFAHPSPQALDQARRIVREGARYNLNAPGFQLDRTLNLPMTALAFLRSGNQARSTFTVDGAESVSGRHTAVVEFKETAKPRMFASSDDAGAVGTFWIVPESGQVRRTRFVFETHRGGTVVTATFRVDYDDVPSLGLCLPKVMDESYSVVNAPTRQSVASMSGRAVYSKYRKFNVSVDEQPAHDDSAH